MKSITMFIVLVFFCHSLFSQCRNISFVNTCSVANGGVVTSDDHCITFDNHTPNGCAGNWWRSHGTPELKPYNYTDPATNQTATGYEGFMWSHPSATSPPDPVGEGMFYTDPLGYTFTTNNKVSFVIRIYSQLEGPGTSVTGNVFIYAINGMTQAALRSCGDYLPSYALPSYTNKQLIKEISNPTIGQWKDYQVTFTPNNNYNQIWIYPQNNTQYQFDLWVMNIQICSPCDGLITYNSGIVTSGQTNGGTINAGSSAGVGGAGTVTNDIYNATQFIATGEINLVHEFQASPRSTNVGEFSAFIQPCGYVPPISKTDINYDSLNPPVQGTVEGNQAFGNPLLTGTVTAEGINSPKFAIFPTIGTGLLYVTGSSDDVVDAELTVVDQLGRKVYYYHNYNDLKITLNLGYLKNGLYYLQIRNAKKMRMEKFIINQ